MLSLQIIPFRATHIPLIKPDVAPDWLNLARIAQNESWAKTVCLVGDPIGCAGIRFGEHGIGETWALFSPLVKRFPKGLVKALKQGIDEVIARKQLTKLIALAEEDDLTAQRFLEHLGFPKVKRKFIYERDL